LLRYPSRTVCIGVENLKVPANDFVGLVARDLLSPFVPATHSPIGIEHQNRVVRDAFEQNLKPPFVILAEREGRGFGHCGVATPRALDGPLGPVTRNALSNDLL
jgi:hypothetical protein